VWDGTDLLLIVLRHLWCVDLSLSLHVCLCLFLCFVHVSPLLVSFHLSELSLTHADSFRQTHWTLHIQHKRTVTTGIVP
jgi:hypothetical protein